MTSYHSQDRFLQSLFDTVSQQHLYIDEVTAFIKTFINSLDTHPKTKGLAEEYIECEFFKFHEDDGYCSYDISEISDDDDIVEIQMGLEFQNNEGNYHICVNVNKTSNAIFIYSHDDRSFEGQFHLGHLALRTQDIVFSEENYIAPNYYISQPNSLLANMREDAAVKDKGVHSLSVPPHRGIEILKPLFASVLTNCNLATTFHPKHRL